LIDAAIFDLDGTLVDLPVDYDKLFEEIRKILKKETVHSLLKTVKEADEEERDRIFRAWDKIELKALPKTTQITEGIGVYSKYCEKPKALVTMQGKNLVKALLKRFDLCFAFSITREQSLDRDKQLEIAARKLRTNVQNILFVGNEDHDEKAARKIGCKFRRVGQRKSGMMPSQVSM